MTLPELDILYEEGPCLVICKPGGLLTQAPPHIDSLDARIRGFIKIRDEKPGRVYLGVPHRLDRPVSGVMVFAKHARAARRLAEQFEGRLVRKIYWAAVEGKTEQEGVWTDYLAKTPNVAHAEIVPEEHPLAKRAVLRYRRLQYCEKRDVSWLEIELETGRMHQIRVQTSARQHAILGDQQYGSNREFGPREDDPRARWIALHARSLRFRHPMTQEMILQQAPLPEYWRELEWDWPEETFR